MGGQGCPVEPASAGCQAQVCCLSTRQSFCRASEMPSTSHIAPLSVFLMRMALLERFQSLQNIGRMTGNLYLWPYGGNLAITVDDKTGALNAHICFAIH